MAAKLHVMALWGGNEKVPWQKGKGPAPPPPRLYWGSWGGSKVSLRYLHPKLQVVTSIMKCNPLQNSDHLKWWPSSQLNNSGEV